MAIVGERIKQRREELKLSQDELATKMGYKSRSTIAKIESGNDDLSQSKLQAFATALETSPGWLLGTAAITGGIVAAAAAAPAVAATVPVLGIGAALRGLAKNFNKKTLRPSPVDTLEEKLKDIQFDIAAIRERELNREHFLDSIMPDNKYELLKRAIRNTEADGSITFNDVKFKLSEQQIAFLANAITMTLEQARSAEIVKQQEELKKQQDKQQEELKKPTNENS